MKTQDAASALQQVAGRLRRSPAADALALLLAGSEPLWPLCAEAVRLVQPMRGPTDDRDLLRMFAEVDTYRALLDQLRMVDGSHGALRNGRPDRAPD